MLNIDKWKIVLTVFLTVLGLLYAAPNVLPEEKKAWLQASVSGWLPSKTVNLGLDLRGGSHLLMEADTKVVLRQRIESMVDAARGDLRKEDIGYTDLSSDEKGVFFTLRDVGKDRAAAYKIARSLEEGSQVDITDDGHVRVTLSQAAVNDINTQVINQSIEIIRRRIDESGTKEPIIQRQGTNRVVVQLPGVDDPEHIKTLLGQTAQMGFHLLDADMMTDHPGPGALRLPMKDNPKSFVVVRKRAIITGEMLIGAQATFEQNAPVVSFRFNAIGGKRFCETTRDNVGKPFAIVLDGAVISAPVIRDAICGGSGIIQGNFSVKEANDLALLLRAGALPAPLKIVEERTVGPTLGSDSVAAGKKAAAVAYGAVILLMLGSYGLFGFFACIALTLNMIFIFALLSLLQATLTLPGIAGIILTMGIAVDSNVLIYERIREEIRQGRSVISAIDTGYSHALRTIFDSNLTTLIVALILFSFGSGPVKGFAVAMSIGIITSLFSALMITRIIIVTWLRRTRPATLTL